MNDWTDETLQDILKISYKTNKKLFSKKSQFQQVEIFDTKGYGKMLFNEGFVMVSERDEFVYHDMIAHVPLFVHPNPKNVLIIGGGDGGTLREVLRHSSVEKCTMVEIDEVVVKACKEHIPQTALEMDNKRATILIEDGVRFVKNTKDLFDVIIIDSSDPIGPATPLFGEEFYSNVKKRLKSEGIVVAQGESPYYEIKMQEKMLSILSNLFSHTSIYNYSNLTYPGGIWSFFYASKSRCPIRDFDKNRVIESGLTFKYYNEEIHKGAFALPTFQRDALKPFLKNGLK